MLFHVFLFTYYWCVHTELVSLSNMRPVTAFLGSVVLHSTLALLSEVILNSKTTQKKHKSAKNMMLSGAQTGHLFAIWDLK